jgi:hypothetical protein
MDALQAGETAQARRLLYRLVSLEPDHKVAWVMLTTLAPTRSACLAALERALQLDPANRALQNGLIALHKEPRSPGTRGRPSISQVVLDRRRHWQRAIRRQRRRVRETVQGSVQHRFTRWRSPWPPKTPSEPLPPQPPDDGPASGPGRSVTGSAMTSLQLSLLGGMLLLVLATFGFLAFLLLGYPTGVSARELASQGSVQDEWGAAATATPQPARTLRPTFTATPVSTDTPTPSPSPSPSPMPSPTDTPAPTQAPATAPVRATRAAALPTRTPVPTRTPLPTHWDPRLDSLGVRVERAPLVVGQTTWRLVEARWADEQEAQGEHLIFIEAQTEEGQRALGQPLRIKWGSGELLLPVGDKPPPEYGANFPMYAPLGSYSVEVAGVASDRVVGLGLGSAEAPDIKLHTCFYLVFRCIVP